MGGGGREVMDLLTSYETSHIQEPWLVRFSKAIWEKYVHIVVGLS